jgi:hypothetical protein
VITTAIKLFEQLLQASLGIDTTELISRSDKERQDLLHHRLVRFGILPSRSQPEILTGPLRTFATALRTCYIPTHSFTGPAKLILMDDPYLDRNTNKQVQKQMITKWKRWTTPDLTVAYAPGNHMTALKSPNVAELANLIREQYCKTYPILQPSPT